MSLSAVLQKMSLPVQVALKALFHPSLALFVVGRPCSTEEFWLHILMGILGGTICPVLERSQGDLNSTTKVVDKVTFSHIGQGGT